MKGKKHTEIAKEKVRLAKKGNPAPWVSERNKRFPLAGEKNPNYRTKIGTTFDPNRSEKKRQRESPEYKTWRKAVYERDKFACQECGIVGGKLEAHHIKSFSKHPEARFSVDNGKTLCIVCHRLTDNYGGKHELYITRGVKESVL